MVFKKKKYYFCVSLVLFLIVAIIVSSIIFAPKINKDVIIEAEGDVSDEPETEKNETTDNEKEPEDESEENAEASDLKEVDLIFTNAWAAFNYANKKNSELKSYVVFNQKGHAVAKILGVPIDVNVSVNRKIYNDIDEVYALTDVNTMFDIGNLGIDVSMYKSFDSLTMFDLKHNYVIDISDWHEPLTDYLEKNGITIYQIPYEISRETATVVGGLVNNPKSPYYEITMNLKPKAWEKYLKALKAIIKIEEYPEIESITVKIKIDKKYGTFHSIEAEEKYSFNYNYSGMTFKLQTEGRIAMKFNYWADISSAVEKYSDQIEKKKEELSIKF